MELKCDMKTGPLTAKALLVAVLVTSAGTAAATSVLIENPNPIVPVQGDLTGSADLTVDQQQLEYTGTNVTGVTVAVNNTAGTDHDGVLHVAVRKTDGTLLTDTDTATKTFSAGGITNATVTFGSSLDVADVSTVEVTVEQTN